MSSVSRAEAVFSVGHVILDISPEEDPRELQPVHLPEIPQRLERRRLQGPEPRLQVENDWRNSADKAIMVFAATAFIGSSFLFVGGMTGHVVTLSPEGCAAAALIMTLAALVIYFQRNTGILTLKQQLDRQEAENRKLEENVTRLIEEGNQIHDTAQELSLIGTRSRESLSQFQEQLIESKGLIQLQNQEIIEIVAQLTRLEEEISNLNRVNQELKGHETALNDQIKNLEYLNNVLNLTAKTLAGGEEGLQQIASQQRDLLQRELDLHQKERELVNKQEVVTAQLIQLQSKLAESEKQSEKLVKELLDIKGRLVAEKLRKLGITVSHLRSFINKKEKKGIVGVA